MRALLAAPSCHVLQETDRHPELLEELGASGPELSGNVIHDLHTVALMKEHGIGELYAMRLRSG